MKVFIADDSSVVRERLANLLVDFKDVQVIGYADNANDAVEFIQKLRPDAVILDIRMPGGSGIEVLHKIKSGSWAPVVIILTNYPYPQYRRRCLNAGADFFFDKSSEFEEIGEVFKQLMEHAH